MRQNPMLSSRVQVGGRQMPQWFSAPMGNPPRATMSTPPPLPAEPPPTMDESEYEEIDHLPRLNGSRRGRSRRVCNLCGNSNAVVVCEMCEDQIFCGGCNDMYHRHPKRLHHQRKLLDPGAGRPPLPPKAFAMMHNSVPQQDTGVGPPIVSSLPPVPPPRRNKRFLPFGMGMRSAGSTPTLTRKVFDPMSTLKRFVGGMGQRPLPPTPKPGPPLPPKPADFGRPVTPTMRGQSVAPFDRRHSSPAPSAMQNFPMDNRHHVPQQMVHEYPGGIRHQSASIANLNIQRPPSRGNNGYPEWEEEDCFSRGRAQSVSIQRFPNSSQDSSHFATLQRPRRGQNNNSAPERPPPPLPPRSYPSQPQLGFQSSQSAFNINHMGMAPQQQFGGGMPWNYPGPGGQAGFPMDFQQAAMMGYPPGGMRRTPSNQSMGGVPQQQGYFGWGPMGFGPPMTQQEMEFELRARRGSESGWPGQGYPQSQAPPRPPSVTQSQPVTPQGSFRRKSRPPPPIEHDRRQEQIRRHEQESMSDRYNQNNQPMNQRPSTPRGNLNRMSQSPINFQESLRDLEEDARMEYQATSSDSPEGPWTCEHCTFINPMSINICTICCKTHRSSKAKKTAVGSGGSKPDTYPRKGSSSSTNDNEEMPVIQSKLSISRGDQQQATINLIESVERVRTPTKDRRLPFSAVSNNKMTSKTGNEEEDDEEEEVDEDDEQELEKQAQHHRIKINTKKPKIISAKSNINDSNEDVYGSVPVQALTLSPKIEIRRHPKTATTTTGVGSSPPKSTQEERSERKPVPVKKKPVDQPTPENGGKSIKPISKSSNENSPSAEGKPNKNKSTSSSSTSSSSSSKSDSIKKPVLSKPMTTSSSSPAKQTVSVSSASVQTTVKRTSKTANEESGSESNPGGSSSSSNSSQSIGITSSIDGEKQLVPTNNSSKLERKSSKGTSPPPQSISTQTYEELPSASSLRQKSLSKTSMQSLQSDDFSLPKPIEMSEKAMRYARKAKANKHHHEAKLKRSLSTHLYSTSEPWVDLDEMIDGHGRSLYRSSSRHSLMSDTRSLPLSGPPSRETSPPRGGGRYFDDFRQFRPPSWDRLPTPEDYFASLEDLVTRQSRKNSVRSQDFELSRLLQEAEDFNFSPEDVQVALKMCGGRNPVKWLQENWSSMVETVQTLATKYGREKGENNQTGTISSTEAKNALRSNKSVWAAVTECIEQRRKKFLELQSRGTFLAEDILTALTANHGNLDAAYVELSKAQLKPFLMKIWNGAVSPPTTASGQQSEIGSSVLKTPITVKENQQHDATKLKQSTRPKSSSKNTSQGAEVPLQTLEPEPRLELLVSNAARVSQEIEKAIQELKQTKNQSTTAESSKTITTRDDRVHLDIQGQTFPVRNDEEENFLDAVSALASDTEVQFSSPLPIQGEDADESQIEDEFYDNDDILEIEIDDTEKNIADPIKSHEDSTVSPVENRPVLEQPQLDPVISTPQINPAQPANVENAPQRFMDQKRENKDDSRHPDTLQGGGNQINATDFEQLLSTLTTTFTEMGQFATDIKAQIATEIQQQLAASVQGNMTNMEASTTTTDPDERVYEPITLSESVSQNVDKKIAKYKRLAAKKELKSNRHKSPDARTSGLKSKSRSPSPGSSLSEGGMAPSSSGLGFSDPETEIDIPDLASSPFPNNAEVIVGADYVDESQLGRESEDDHSRDEGEYNSGPDDESESEEEISDEDLEEGDSKSEEIVDEDNLEEISDVVTGSSEGDEEGRLIEGAYEEIDVNHSSDVEIYNNKDIENKVLIASGNDSKHFVPSPLENLERESLPVVESKPEEMGDDTVTKSEKDIKIERFMTAGKVETEEKAELAVQLIDMNFTEDDSVYAANECSSLYSALSFLQQECDLCAGKFSARQMVSMLRCVHVCCHNCAKEYFTVQVRDKSIVDATCPFCSEPPNLNDDPEGATEYFNHLDILLKSILEPRFHEMFQRKLRDWALAKTPNFKWCSKCSSGFITEPLQTRLICPDCNAVTCAICLEQWDKSNHYHRESKVKVCDSSSKSIVDYLNENCVECPRCHFRFSLARGGCMHLTCTQCRHEFCSGCSASFKMGNKCDAKLPICDKLGLHAHHPRNCLFYLRDKEPDILGKLLEENAIPYLKENSGESPNDANPCKRTCQVPIQKETSDGLKDDICGKDAPTGYATVCDSHYVEYLGLLIWQNHLDPISILSCDDLEVIIRRANKKHPGRPYSTSDEAFRNRLLKVIQDEIPL